MNDNINAIIKDGKVYVVNTNDGGNDYCKDCDLVKECRTNRGFSMMCLWLNTDNFKFSQKLTDRLNKQ